MLTPNHLPRKQNTLVQQFTICLIASTYIATAGAATLDLADNALEVVSAVEPNIVILTDDSGSMDLSIMATGPDSGNDGELTYNGRLYSYAHPAPNSSGNAPAINIFTREHALTEEYLKNVKNVAAPYHGAWRAWNKDFNRVYYDPDVTYKPWSGLNKSGTAYGPASVTQALYNPYEPTTGSLNLTTTTPTYLSAYGGSNVTADGFYPARYYTWTDSDSDGYPDADEPHQLIEIRQSGCTSGASCPSTFTRNKLNTTAGLGRSDCSTDNGNGTVTCTYSEEIQNFANWFSYYRKRGLAANANFGFIIEKNTTARIGYATIHNNNSVAIPVASMNVSAKSGNKKKLLDKIYQTKPNSGTPLRENLRDTGYYFECKSSHIFSSVSPSPACPILPAPAGTCQQNYTVLMTDGFYNGPDPYSSGGNKDADTSNKFDGGATSDGWTNTLADVAMDFYKRDLSALTDDVSPTSKDISRYPPEPPPNDVYPTNPKGKPNPMHQHMATYTIGLGVSGTLTSMPSDPAQTSFPWPNPTSSSSAKIDDLRHAAYNGRGSFLQATNPLILQQGLEAIFEEIGQTGGAASAVAFNTQNIESGSLVFRAFFDTKLNTGDLVAQKVNLDGSISPIEAWSAATQLDSKTPASRVIITYKDSGLSSSGLQFQWNQLTSGTGSQRNQLDAPQPANVAGSIGSDRLDWLRGIKTKEGPSFDDGQFRERGAKSLLGDLVHSAPVFVGKPEFNSRDNPPYPNASSSVLYSTYRESYKNRKGLVYVGANDGMLHAFEAQTGDEVFAYVPNLVFNNLSTLTNPDYTHRFFVDLTPSVGDVFMGGNWASVLVGGLGKGGKGYYALNVTDPTAFNTQATAATKVMWEFTETDDGSVGNSDLGFTYSQPVIAMTNSVSGGEQRWAAIFGNGYNSTSSNGDATLYILFLDGGTDGVWTPSSDFIKISTPNGKAESADGSTPNGIGGIRAIDTDLNGTADYIYAGDLQGNLYRFDLKSTNTNQWTNNGVLYKATYGSPAKAQPITNRPIVVKHPTATGFIVVFGTGSWMTNTDQSSNDIQSIYGIWDDLSTLPNNGSASIAANTLIQQVFKNESSTINNFSVRTLSNNPVQWKNNGSNQVRGWRIDLDVPPANASSGVEFPGERAVRNLQLRGGLLFVNTVIPKPINQCSAGVGGFELGFNPITGGSGSKIIFDLSDDGVFNIDDNVNQVDNDANIVTGLRFDDSTPADSSFIGNTRVTQTSDKSVRTTKTNTDIDTGTGRQSWREIEL